MSKSSSTSSADSNVSLSDYKFWRSQLRPGGSGGADEQSSTDRIWGAICNRFGEELGHRLDGLVWPMVPEVMKRLTGVVGGRLWPLIVSGGPLLRGINRLSTKKSISQGLYNQIQVEIDGRKDIPEWNDMGDLFELLCGAQYYWTIRPKWASDEVVKYYQSDYNADGVCEHWYEQWAFGQMVEQEVSLPALERFERVKAFLRNLFLNRLLKELNEQGINIDTSVSLDAMDEETLESVLVFALCLKWAECVEAAF